MSCVSGGHGEGREQPSVSILDVTTPEMGFILKTSRAGI